VTASRPAEFEAVTTKLLVPERRHGLVDRPQLVHALEDARAGRLTIVSAPTGFGKTSTVAEWAAAGPARFAWVSLDEADDDPTRFWRYVVAALEGAVAAFPDTAARRLRSPGVAIADEVLPALVNGLALVEHPLVLALDDYHAVAAEEIHQGVDFLVERLPPGVHVVLVSQTAPPLRLGRLRARRELTELRPAQLRFSDEEAGALLNGLHALGLAPEVLADLQLRTEGWVAGLNLIALTLRDRAEHADVLARMPVDDRFLVDYLWEEVVERQAPELRDFLIRTSILQRLSSTLCDAVTGRRDGAAVLAQLERGNLFVIPLDPERRWFRFHHLFREMLQRQLLREAPAEVPELHRRASAWFAARGDLHGTVEHAISAGDAEAAAATLDGAWLDLYSGGQATTLLGWIDRLPRETVLAFPELVLARGGVARAMGRLEEAEPWFDLAEEAARSAQDEGLRRDILAGVARHRAMMRLAHADVGEAVALARRAVAIRPEGSPEAGIDTYFLAICIFFTGMRGEAETLLRRYLEATPPGEQDVRRVFAMALLAQAHAERGELEAAEALIAESLGTGSARGLDEHPPTQQVHLAAGVVALARGDADGAEARFEHAAALARRGGDRVEIASAMIWLGRSRAAAGDLGGAGDALRGADERLAGARVPGLVPSREALEAALRDAAPAAPAPDAGAALSGEERDVLALLAGDLTYAAIGERLGLGTDEVRARYRRIRRHLGAITRDEAVTVARRRELI